MIYRITALLFFISFNIMSQVTLRAGMGINFQNSPSLTDYINQNFAQTSQLGSFNTAVSFSVEGDYRLSKNFEIGLEGAYLINSYTYAFEGKYEFAYNVIMPTAVAYYVIDGPGYNFKFGGGIGPRFSSVAETLPFSNAANNYTSTGFGFLIKGDGNTALSSRVYANIGVDLRYDINGAPQHSGNYIHNIDQKVNLNSLTVGIRLGVSYIF